MVLEIIFKTPDALEKALEQVPENQREKARKSAEKFIRNGEYLTIELYTEIGEAKVKEI